MNASPESTPRPPHKWLGDSPERQTDNTPHAKEVVAALVVVGFDTLRDLPTPPSEVLANFASALQIYELHRLADSPNAVTQRILDDDADASESDFLQRAFEVMETVHALGVSTRAITAQLLTQSARFTDIEHEVAGDATFHGGHAEQVWRHGIQEVLPEGY
jgi:hypothetical protein